MGIVFYKNKQHIQLFFSVFTDKQRENVVDSVIISKIIDIFRALSDNKKFQDLKLLNFPLSLKQEVELKI